MKVKSIYLRPGLITSVVFKWVCLHVLHCPTSTLTIISGSPGSSIHKSSRVRAIDGRSEVIGVVVGQPGNPGIF